MTQSNPVQPFPGFINFGLKLTFYACVMDTGLPKDTIRQSVLKLGLSSAVVACLYFIVLVPTFKPVIQFQSTPGLQARLAIPLQQEKAFTVRWEFSLRHPFIGQLSLTSGLQPDATSADVAAPEIASAPPESADLKQVTVLDYLSQSPLQENVQTAPEREAEIKPEVPVPSHKPLHLSQQSIQEWPEPAARAFHPFLQPVKGELISRFVGPRYKHKNKALLIRSTPRSEIKAAENGVVVFVGKQLKGLGSVILIKHADEWISAYGKVGQVQVQSGEIVRRGETVGYVANSKHPHLLFELYHREAPQNPLDHIGGN